jgi:hypothetical protein
MAGILPDGFAGSSSGVLPFGNAPAAQNPLDANRNAILGYLAGALQGGNLGQSIGRGLAGWMGGTQPDATEHAQQAALHYAAQQPDIEPALRAALLQSPALALHYLQTRTRPHATSDITHYEYAKRQGFTGTLADFIQRKRPGALGFQE